MYKANQEALFQATNIGLINIRQSELTYYLTVNQVVGTQAALVGGFTYSIFTQNQINENNAWGQTAATLYYIAASGTIAAAVHVVINTMLLQVLGPGLALNGPVGSMTRAADGMRRELPQVIIAFAIMIISFATSTTLSFWVVMDMAPAIISSLVFGIAARCWYFYSKRVFLRFYFDSKANRAWREDEEEDDDPAAKLSQRFTDATNNSASAEEIRKDSKCKAAAEEEDDNSVSTRFIRYLGWFPPLEKSSSRKAGNNSPSSDAAGSNNTAAAAAPGGGTEGMDERTAALNTARLRSKSAAAMEGYLYKRGVSKSEMLLRDPWERRYFVLNAQGNIYYYKTRQEYREDSKAAMKQRPIDLAEYYVNIRIREEDGTLLLSSGVSEAGESIDTSMTALAINTNEKTLFQLTLVPREDAAFRHWVLRSDTREELEAWITAMKQVSPSSFNKETK